MNFMILLSWSDAGFPLGIYYDFVMQSSITKAIFIDKLLTPGTPLIKWDYGMDI